MGDARRASFGGIRIHWDSVSDPRVTGYVLYYETLGTLPHVKGRIHLPRSATSYAFEPHLHVAEPSRLTLRLTSTDGTRESEAATIVTATAIS